MQRNVNIVSFDRIVALESENEMKKICFRFVGTMRFELIVGVCRLAVINCQIKFETILVIVGSA